MPFKNGKPPPNPTGIGLTHKWKSGESGNPGGRISFKPFMHQLKHAIAIDNKDRLRKTAEKLLTLAARGEPWAVQFLVERLDGKAPVDINITRDTREMSLDDILAELAEVRAASGVAGADAGPEESGSVH